MNTTHTRRLQSHEDVLEEIAKTIDIPEHLTRVARERYQSISSWLDREGSEIKVFHPAVYPQGSFLLGTVIRPVGDAEQYDIDLVLTLSATKQNFTMARLKCVVGAEIAGYAEAHGMNNKPEDNRRCWTMEYAENANFHIDILPSLPDDLSCDALTERRVRVGLSMDNMIREKAIAITDKIHPKYDVLCDEWPVSNPKGYGIWFKSRQAKIVDEHKHALRKMNRGYSMVDDVPDHEIKTPLQRAIQLLKRHRDVMFGCTDDKPISIIITTLAGLAYNGEKTISETLGSVLKGMHRFVEDREGVTWVENPVNPSENFADKWSENPQKEEFFFSWLDKACKDFGLYLSSSAYDQVPKDFQKALSESTTAKVLPMIAAPPAAVASPSDIGAEEVARVIHKGEATKPWRQ